MAGKIARCHGEAANIRRDFAHQSSRAMADSDTQVFVGEALKIQNMVKAPEPKPAGGPDKHGKIKYEKNGRKAKSGLAKSILESCWGTTWTYLQYKAKRKGKLSIKVPYAYSSQTCAECGHTNPDNRPTQAQFRCMHCGHEDNADHNAASVIKQRGIALLIAGKVEAPKRKKTMRMANIKQDVGPEGSERVAETPPKLETAGIAPEPSASSTEETSVRRRKGNTRSAQRSKKRETPATRPQGL